VIEVDVVAVAARSATTLTAATEVVGDEGADTASTGADFFEFDSGTTGFDAGCSDSGAGVGDTGSSG
jgi:hypothetical protein